MKRCLVSLLKQHRHRFQFTTAGLLSLIILGTSSWVLVNTIGRLNSIQSARVGVSGEVRVEDGELVGVLVPYHVIDGEEDIRMSEVPQIMLSASIAFVTLIGLLVFQRLRHHRAVNSVHYDLQ